MGGGQRRPRTRLAFTAVASDGMEFQTGQEIPAFGMGFEAYELIDPEKDEALRRTAVTMLHGVDCPAGYMPVVIDGGFGGVITRPACIHWRLPPSPAAIPNSAESWARR